MSTTPSNVPKTEDKCCKEGKLCQEKVCLEKKCCENGKCCSKSTCTTKAECCSKESCPKQECCGITKVFKSKIFYFLFATGSLVGSYFLWKKFYKKH